VGGIYVPYFVPGAITVRTDPDKPVTVKKHFFLLKFHFSEKVAVLSLKAASRIRNLKIFPESTKKNSEQPFIINFLFTCNFLLHHPNLVHNTVLTKYVRKQLT
jgi:hypothetical protein